MKQLRKVSRTRDEWVQNAIETRVHPENVARNPDRYVHFFNRAYARLQLQKAVKKGKLLKPSECSGCGRGPLASKELHGHHPDYDKPLEVEWVCRECHAIKHDGRYLPNGSSQAVR